LVHSLPINFKDAKLGLPPPKTCGATYPPPSNTARQVAIPGDSVKKKRDKIMGNRMMVMVLALGIERTEGK